MPVVKYVGLDEEWKFLCIFPYHILGTNATASVILRFKFHLSNIKNVGNKENSKM